MGNEARQIDFRAQHMGTAELWDLYEFRTKYSPLPLLVTEGPRHLIRYANSAFCKLASKDPKQIRGLPFSAAISDESTGECLAVLDRVFSTGVHETLRRKKRDGGDQTAQQWTYSVWSLMEVQDPHSGLIIHVSDPSETEDGSDLSAQVSEALLLFSLQQLDAQDKLTLAIRETEHRVKNSLHTVSILVGALLRSNPDAIPKIELAKLQMHIRTIAAMHKFLGFSESANASDKKVSARTALMELLPMWQAIVGPGQIRWESDDVEIPLKSCTSLVTAINELVCNSVKHGAHSIVLTLSASGQSAKLTVVDDGPGFPKDFKSGGSRSFGLKFVEAVVRGDLKGEIDYKAGPSGGAVVDITFPYGS